MAKRTGWILIILFILTLLLRSFGQIATSMMLNLCVSCLVILIIVRPYLFIALPAKIILSSFLIFSLALLQYWIPLSPSGYFILTVWIIFSIVSYKKLLKKLPGFILYLLLTMIFLSAVVLNPRRFHNFYRSTTYEEYIISKYPEQQGIVADLFINKYKDIDKPASDELFKRAIFSDSIKDDLTALRLYNRSIDLNPDNPEAYHRRGFLKLSRLELGPDVAYSAVKDFSRAIRLNPQYAEAYYHRSLALGYLGNTGRAILDTRKVMEIDSSMKEEAFQAKYGRSKKSFSVPSHS